MRDTTVVIDYAALCTIRMIIGTEHTAVGVVRSRAQLLHEVLFYPYQLLQVLERMAVLNHKYAVWCNLLVASAL